MKYKISAVLLSVVLVISCIFIPCGVSFASSVSTYSGLAEAIEKRVSLGVISSLDGPEFKYSLLTCIRDYCVANNIDPSTDDFVDFILFCMNLPNSGIYTEYIKLHGNEYVDIYNQLFPYFNTLFEVYDMGSGSIQLWLEEHLNDTNTGFNDNGDVFIPVDDFKDEVEKQNTTISPKNPGMLKYSWRELSPKQENPYLGVFARGIFKKGESVVGTSLEDGIYIQIYMRRNGAMYYVPYQYHIFCKDELMTSGSDGDAYRHDWYMEPIYYERFDGVCLDTFSGVSFSYYDKINNSGSVARSNMDYISFGLGYETQASLSLQCYKSLGGCVHNLKSDYATYYDNRGVSFTRSSVFPPSTEGYTSLYSENYNNFLRSDDVTDKIDGSSYSGIRHFFNGSSSNEPITVHDTGVHTNGGTSSVTVCDEGSTCDFGFLVSATEFSTTYSIDTTKLPTNSTVTITGDSAYDYSITDNSTGDTTTIYNYVTNNYAYPEGSGGNTSGGSDSGSGGTVGGDVSVGGKVDIGGKVDVGGKVDINVSVNGNNGGNGNINDWIDVNSSDVDSNVADYIELVPKLSKNFIDYMKDFFSWLPKEVYGLFIAGLVFLVVRLVFHRR